MLYWKSQVTLPNPTPAYHHTGDLADPLATDFRRLGVEESDTIVVLTGTVSRYYLKQLAQETVMPLLAGRKLLNRVEVERT